MVSVALTDPSNFSVDLSEMRRLQGVVEDMDGKLFGKGIFWVRLVA